MMILKMDKTTASSPRERAKSIFDKTVGLETKRRKAAQARVPSDPNLWQQIRENYEAIILEDNGFSEKHNIELTLWQLHYKRIEEFRSHINAVLASGSSSVPQNGKGPSRPDQIAKLKLQFRTFLSEATGFYHDMILKIRSKYGLPLGYFSEDQETQNLADKDGNKSAEVKKGLVSCHRCLIYLGDLARYKGLYGEGDSKNREFAAASSYYLQAASLLPASGNPHHQLAIIASYSGDDFAATYRYFRSLAVESPFPTARDNLIVAFEKNRQSYAQLFVASKDSSKRLTSKGRGKGQAISSRDANVVASPEKDKVTCANEMLKAFCIRFVRLNGILFTRTSLETFPDVLASTSSCLCEVISSGSVEELNLGIDTSDSALFIVRLVAILIFSVHNSKKETEGQSYAEIVQRVEPVRNSLTASFELLGHVIEQCAKHSDPSSSYFLPGVLVFVEWLACCPDIGQGSDPDDRQAAVRNSFWNQCVVFFNKVLSLGPMIIDDVEDETCFSNMSLYDERETENRFALWEDYELRGFLPLLPAQTILDFSRKHSFGTEGSKSKKARVKRILAAGKSLISVIKIDHNPVYFDSKKKKFLIGVKPSVDLLDSHSSLLEADNALQDNQVKIDHSSLVMQKDKIYMGEEDDDDEVIVFKPLVTEKRKEASDQMCVPSGGFRKSDQVATMGDLRAMSGSDASLHENQQMQARSNECIQVPASVGLEYIQPSTQSQAVHLQQIQTQAVNPQLAHLQQVQTQAVNSQLAHLQQVQTQAVNPPLAHLQQVQTQAVNPPLAHLQQVQTQVVNSQLAQLQQIQTQAVNPQLAQSLAAARLQPMQSQVAQLQPLSSRAVHFQQTQAHVSPAHLQSTSFGGVSKWLPENAASVPSSLTGFAQMSNGHVMRNNMQGNHGASFYNAHSLPVHQSYNVNGVGGVPYSESRIPEPVFPPRVDAVSSSGVTADGLGAQSSLARKNPISRPSRHIGPPPGFNSVPSKLQKEPAPGSDLASNSLPVDDYSWLDGYQAQSSRGAGFNSSFNYASSGKPEHMFTSNGINGFANFPLPGKQVPTSQVQADFPYFQNPQKDNFVGEIHQSAQLTEQYQGQSTWPSRHFV